MNCQLVRLKDAGRSGGEDTRSLALAVLQVKRLLRHSSGDAEWYVMVLEAFLALRWSLFMNVLLERNSFSFFLNWSIVDNTSCTRTTEWLKILKPYSIYSYDKILPICPVLYNISFWLIYSIRGALCLLVPYPYFASPQWWPLGCSLYLWVC